MDHFLSTPKHRCVVCLILESQEGKKKEQTLNCVLRRSRNGVGCMRRRGERENRKGNRSARQSKMQCKMGVWENRGRPSCYRKEERGRKRANHPKREYNTLANNSIEVLSSQPTNRPTELTTHGGLGYKRLLWSVRGSLFSLNRKLLCKLSLGSHDPHFLLMSCAHKLSKSLSTCHFTFVQPCRDLSSSSHRSMTFPCKMQSFFFAPISAIIPTK